MGMTIAEVSRKYELTQDTLRYYEKVGMIPSVSRTKGGIRDYHEEDCAWIELAKCMRNAGFLFEMMVEYVRLHQIGDSTLYDRMMLLSKQRDILLEQQKQIGITLERLNFKISRYDTALKTGVLSWKE